MTVSRVIGADSEAGSFPPAIRMPEPGHKSGQFPEQTALQLLQNICSLPIPAPLLSLNQ